MCRGGPAVAGGDTPCPPRERGRALLSEGLMCRGGTAVAGGDTLCLHWERVSKKAVWGALDERKHRRKDTRQGGSTLNRGRRGFRCLQNLNRRSTGFRCLQNKRTLGVDGEQTFLVSPQTFSSLLQVSPAPPRPPVGQSWERDGRSSKQECAFILQRRTHPRPRSFVQAGGGGAARNLERKKRNAHCASAGSPWGCPAGVRLF